MTILFQICTIIMSILLQLRVSTEIVNYNSLALEIYKGVLAMPTAIPCKKWI